MIQKTLAEEGELSNLWPQQPQESIGNSGSGISATTSCEVDDENEERDDDPAEFKVGSDIATSKEEEPGSLSTTNAAHPQVMGVEEEVDSSGRPRPQETTTKKKLGRSWICGRYQKTCKI